MHRWTSGKSSSVDPMTDDPITTPERDDPVETPENPAPAPEPEEDDDAGEPDRYDDDDARAWRGNRRVGLHKAFLP